MREVVTADGLIVRQENEEGDGRWRNIQGTGEED